MFAAAMAVAASAAAADRLAGRVTAGIRVADPVDVVDRLAADPRIDDDALLFVAWTVPLDGTGSTAAAERVRAAGAHPWLTVRFTTPAPLGEHLDRLESELAELASLARTAGDDVFFQAEWRPDDGVSGVRDLAYLIKRAAVVVTGASATAGFAAGPLPSDPTALDELYDDEIAAYLDAVVLGPGVPPAAVVSSLAALDPGKPLVATLAGGAGVRSIAALARAAAAGASVVLFEPGSVSDVDVSALKVAAHELGGNLVHDPFSAPTGAGPAWTFVREDLDLRVVAERPPGGSRTRLVFADPQLRSPERVDLGSGESVPVTGVRRGSEFIVVVDPSPEVVLLRLERPTAAEIEAFGEEIEIGGDREMPVAEILRRLQAFEDDQSRRIRHYQARRSMSLRFQGRQGSIEATYAGDFFSTEDSFDWVWSEFYVGGVKWRSRKLPKVPLIQPEKVAALPVEIRLEKDYDYRLRGTDVVDGRDCWVIDFKPATAAPDRSLYRGTVWVDREIYARVRTRAVQVGLEGDVLSNEETYYFSPIDAEGRPAPWSASSYILPLRISGQQVFTILNATLPVEVDNRFTEVRINGDDFDANRSAALASDATMVRDTEAGLRYLNQTKDGERVVEENFDSNRLFLVGGVFWDESVDYPIPAIGVNYLDLDFKDSGAQLNVFFAGLFVAANLADPDFLGSRWNAGANLNGRFFKANDELYRDGEVVPEETVRQRAGTFNLFAGRPLGKFMSLELTYRARYEDYHRADDTADDFTLPTNTLTHGFEASLDYNRSGFRVAVAGEVDRRSSWEPWGLPGNAEYDPDQRDYQRWQLTVAKTWWLPKFHKIGLVLEHLDSVDTDRFSGYDFGLFGDSTVAGYPIGLVRAERASGGHLTGGINVFELIRVTVSADAMWATNRTTGLDNELLAGIGVGGTVTLPWQLIMNFDVGYALAGPGQGDVAVRVFLLKLFPND
ncbi:MAG: hypothetical protein PVG53_09695 [Holophagae bacterium]